jgi:hypothetical protein
MDEEYWNWIHFPEQNDDAADDAVEPCSTCQTRQRCTEWGECLAPTRD